jgi:hypothetical protein
MKTYLVALSLVIGCGDNNGGTKANPLVGTWKNTMNGFTSTYSFSANNTLAFAQNGTDTGTACTTNANFTGTWTSTATTLSYTVTAGTTVVSNCTDPAMNSNTAADATQLSQVSQSNVNYVISGNMLTLTVGTVPLVLTRQ